MNYYGGAGLGGAGWVRVGRISNARVPVGVGVDYLNLVHHKAI